MFLVDLKYKVGVEEVDKFVVAHRKWLDTLYSENKLLCSGPKNPRNGGIIIALLDDLHELKTLLLEDPFYINGVAEYAITEFNPNKFHHKLYSNDLK